MRVRMKLLTTVCAVAVLATAGTTALAATGSPGASSTPKKSKIEVVRLKLTPSSAQLANHRQDRVRRLPDHGSAPSPGHELHCLPARAGGCALRGRRVHRRHQHQRRRKRSQHFPPDRPGGLLLNTRQWRSPACRSQSDRELVRRPQRRRLLPRPEQPGDAVRRRQRGRCSGLQLRERGAAARALASAFLAGQAIGRAGEAGGIRRTLSVSDCASVAVSGSLPRKYPGANLGAIRTDGLARQANGSGQAGGDHGSSRTGPDDAERLTGICGSEGQRVVCLMVWHGIEPRGRRRGQRVGFQNSATCPGLGFYAARSYSLMRPPRTSRHLIRSWEKSATGWSGRGGRSWRPRWGRCPL